MPRASAPNASTAIQTWQTTIERCCNLVTHKIALSFAFNVHPPTACVNRRRNCDSGVYFAGLNYYRIFGRTHYLYTNWGPGKKERRTKKSIPSCIEFSDGWPLVAVVLRCHWCQRRRVLCCHLYFICMKRTSTRDEHSEPFRARIVARSVYIQLLWHLRVCVCVCAIRIRRHIRFGCDLLSVRQDHRVWVECTHHLRIYTSKYSNRK